MTIVSQIIYIKTNNVLGKWDVKNKKKSVQSMVSMATGKLSDPVG